MKKIFADIRKILQQAGSILAGLTGSQPKLHPAPAPVRTGRVIRRRSSR